MNLDALDYISEDHLVFNPIVQNFFDAMFTMRLWMHKFFSLHQGFTGILGSPRGSGACGAQTLSKNPNKRI